MIGLDNDRRQLVGILTDHAFCRFEVVVGHNHDLVGRFRGHSAGGQNRVRRVGIAGRRDIGRDADLNRVVVAVIRAFALRQQVLAGKGARRTDGVERRFGAGVDETDLVERWHAFAHQLAPLDHQGRGRGIRHTLLKLRRQSLDHRGMPMTEYERRHVVDEIDALVAVNVGDR